MAFTKFCSLAFHDEQGSIIFFDSKYLRSAATELLGSSGYIDHFISIGLIGSKEYNPGNSDISGMKVSYFGCEYELHGPQPKKTPGLGLNLLQIPISIRMFSQVGYQLGKIAGAEMKADFIEEVAKSFAEEFEFEIRATFP